MECIKKTELWSTYVKLFLSPDKINLINSSLIFSPRNVFVICWITKNQYCLNIYEETEYDFTLADFFISSYVLRG